MVTAVVFALSVALASQPAQEPHQRASGSSDNVAESTEEPLAVASENSSSDAQTGKLDKSHPDYVRCKREAVIGSRAKRKKTCMTNSEWRIVERRGNEASKTFAGDNFANGYN